MTYVAVLRVVIVFDDPCIRSGGPTKEFQAAIRRHRDPHWKLIRWCDVSEFCFGCKLTACLHDEAVSVYWYWNNPRACGAECLKCSGIARVFHPDLIASGEQETADEVESLLDAQGDDDLFGGAAYSA